MKLKMKTMATLLAAILIAMMGVMPALAAPTASIPLTVTVVPIVSISVMPPLTVDFGTPRPGEVVIEILEVFNDGDFDVTVSAEVSGAFFITNLVVSGTYTSLVIDETDDAILTLTIPGAEPAGGPYAGSILFTATAVPP